MQSLNEKNVQINLLYDLNQTMIVTSKGNIHVK